MKTSFTKFFKFSCLLAVALLTNISAQAQAGLIINSPADAAGIFTDIGTATFGPQLIDIEDVTGNLILADDNEGCLTAAGENSIMNGAEIAGNIAVIDRGACQFQEKTGNAQELGAVAVIICNNVAGDPITMGGENDTLTIPAIMLTLDFCNELKVILANEPINATIGNPFNLSQSTTAYAHSTPCSQITALQDLATTVSNRTDNNQTDIVLTCEITDPDGAVTTFTENVDVLTSRSDSTVTFDEYLPGPIGEYTVRFFNNGEAIGNYLQGLDEETLSFNITEDFFALDDGGLNPGGITVGGGGDFSMGALFFAENDIEALSATFAISEPDSILGEMLTVILYEVNDPAVALDQNNVSVIGFHEYEVTADDVADELITVDLANFSSPGDPVNMVADGIYVLMVEYIGSNFFFITASGTINYPTVASIVVAPDANGVSTWFTGGFNSGVTAILRLNVTPPVGGDCTVSVNEPELDDSQITLMPNPASETVNILLDLEEASETVQIHLFDIMGRAVQSEVHNNVQDQLFTMDVSNLPTGTYFISVITEEGRKALKLSVNH